MTRRLLLTSLHGGQLQSAHQSLSMTTLDTPNAAEITTINTELRSSEGLSRSEVDTTHRASTALSKLFHFKCCFIKSTFTLGTWNSVLNGKHFTSSHKNVHNETTKHVFACYSKYVIAEMIKY